MSSDKLQLDLVCAILRIEQAWAAYEEDLPSFSAHLLERLVTRDVPRLKKHLDDVGREMLDQSRTLG